MSSVGLSGLARSKQNCVIPSLVHPVFLGGRDPRVRPRPLGLSWCQKRWMIQHRDSATPPHTIDSRDRNKDFSTFQAASGSGYLLLGMIPNLNTRIVHESVTRHSMIGSLVTTRCITIWPEFNKQAKSGGEAECNSNQHQRSKMSIPWVTTYSCGDRARARRRRHL